MKSKLTYQLARCGNIYIICILLGLVFNFNAGEAQSNPDRMFSVSNTSGSLAPSPFLMCNPNYPWVNSTTTANTGLHIGLNYLYRRERATVFGGNLCVGQDIDVFGNYLGKWSFKGAFDMPYYPATTTQQLVTPGKNYLVDYHRWGNYMGLFGLRERTTRMGVILDGEPLIQNPDGEIKDAILSWGYEFGTESQAKSRLIFQSVEGIDPNGYLNSNPNGVLTSAMEREHATILYNGNFGLGTNSPNSHLEILPDPFAVASGQVVDPFRIKDINGTSQFVVTNSGNVGINSSNPSNSLEVNGNVKTNGEVYMKNSLGFGINTFTLSGGEASFQTTTAPSSGYVFRVGRGTSMAKDILAIHEDGALVLNGDFYDINKNSGITNTFGYKRLVWNSITGLVNYVDFDNSPDQVWQVHYANPSNPTFGNTITTGVTNAFLGTDNNVDVSHTAAGQTGFRIIGRLPIGSNPDKRGFVEFQKPVAMGGTAEAIASTSLTLMQPQNQTGYYALNCINSNGTGSAFRVDNQTVSMLNGNWEFNAANLIAAGNIKPISNNMNSIGDLSSRWNSIYFTDMDIAGSVTGHLIPSIPAAVISPTVTQGFDLGSSSFPWRQSHNLLGSWTSSDRRLKSDINQLDMGLSLVKKLNPVGYNYKNGDGMQHYGFIAQELKELFPNSIVKGQESDSTFLSVNYDEFIPILTKSIQEQQQIIDTLKKQISLLVASNVTKGSENPPTQKEVLNQAPVLFQNNPNPFSGITFIDYFLPQNTKNAFIRVVDNTGKLIKAFALNSVGYGQVEVDCQNLVPGAYHYSLIIDSKLVETKTMILADRG